MKTKNFFKLMLVGILSIASTQSAMAAKNKVFYDSKSDIIGVSGAVDSLNTYGFGSKIFNNPVNLPKISFSDDIEVTTKKLNDAKVGNLILNYLFQTQNGELSEELLKQRALSNAQRCDIEFANANFKDASTVLREDVYPILSNNFIFFQRYYTNDKGKNGKIDYQIYKVDVTRDMVDGIYNYWSASYLNNLDVPVVFVASGTADWDDEYASVQKDISNKAPEFAMRGQIIQRNPAKIDLTYEQGARKGDLVSIYRQKIDKDNTPYSQRISRARICGANSENSQLYFVAGTKGNRKLGDIAVITRDHKYSIGVDATWMQHIYGAQINFDYQLGFTRAGFVHHAIADLAIAVTDKPGKTFSTDYESFKSPIFANIGIGYGISKHLAGFMEIMPYFLVQGEYGYMMNKEEFSSSNDNKKGIGGIAIRVPVGVRFSFNIAYPLQLSLTGGYAFNKGFNKDNDFYSSYAPIKEACDYLSVKRQGLFIQAGLRYNF